MRTSPTDRSGPIDSPSPDQHKLVSSSRPINLLLIFYALHSFIGLSYEVVWIKYLTATLGMTAPAFSVVLATFMAGLGIGSFALFHAISVWHPFICKTSRHHYSSSPCQHLHGIPAHAENASLINRLSH